LKARHRAGVRPAEIRSFAWIVAAGVVLLFTAVPWIRGHSPRLWPAPCAVVLVGLAYAAPRLLEPFYRGWMRLGHVLGWINSRIILGAVFYLVFLPIGVIRRAGGRGPVRRSFAHDATPESYRVPRTGAVPPERMEKPY
jgi:hypothetical protein